MRVTWGSLDSWHFDTDNTKHDDQFQMFPMNRQPAVNKNDFILADLK
jgi:hypothetical protein